ncbi:MAG: sugar kinase, partial [Cyanobium sp. MAG_04]|nr:sugar kinase [Cyanobium sp. MAG_04]
MNTALAVGVDLGSSGLRIALIGPDGEQLIEESSPYPSSLEEPLGWVEGLTSLCGLLPAAALKRVRALAVDGTSGTLLLCRADGQPGPGCLGQALPYHFACREQAPIAAAIAGSGPAASANGSLARALHLLAQAQAIGAGGPWLLRHQADWLTGWLLGDWSWG